MAKPPKPPLSEDLIWSWALRHREATSRWPANNTGPVLGAEGETWGAVGVALFVGYRGLPGGDTLARFIARRSVVTTRLPAEVTVRHRVLYREVPGHPGYYAGRDGGVWSAPDERPRRRKTWKRLSPYRHKTGYLYLCLRGGRNVKVHALILRTFVGPCPRGMECRHLDGDPTNNRLENLCWGTRKENLQDAVRHGTHRRGSQSHKARLTEADVPEVRRLRAAGMSLKAIAARYGVAKSTIGALLSGRSWAHVPLVAAVNQAT